MNNVEARWLVDVFQKEHQGRILKGETLNAYYEAERILKGKKKIDRRGCSCQFKDLAKMVNSLMEQHESKIKMLYHEEIQSVSRPEGD